MLHDSCMACGWVQLEQERWLVCHSLDKICSICGWVEITGSRSPSYSKQRCYQRGRGVRGSGICLVTLRTAVITGQNFTGRSLNSVLHLKAWKGAFLSLPEFLFRVGHIPLPLLAEQHPAQASHPPNPQPGCDTCNGFCGSAEHHRVFVSCHSFM